MRGMALLPCLWHLEAGRWPGRKTSRWTSPPRLTPSRVGHPEVMVIVVVVLASAIRAAASRPVPAALVVVAASAADLVTGGRRACPGRPSGRRSR